MDVSRAYGEANQLKLKRSQANWRSPDTYKAEILDQSGRQIAETKPGIWTMWQAIGPDGQFHAKIVRAVQTTMHEQS